MNCAMYTKTSSDDDGSEGGGDTYVTWFMNAPTASKVEPLADRLSLINHPLLQNPPPPPPPRPSNKYKNKKSAGKLPPNHSKPPKSALSNNSQWESLSSSNFDKQDENNEIELEENNVSDWDRDKDEFDDEAPMTLLNEVSFDGSGSECSQDLKLVAVASTVALASAKEYEASQEKYVLESSNTMSTQDSTDESTGKEDDSKSEEDEEEVVEESTMWSRNHDSDTESIDQERAATSTPPEEPKESSSEDSESSTLDTKGTKTDPETETAEASVGVDKSEQTIEINEHCSQDENDYVSSISSSDSSVSTLCQALHDENSRLQDCISHEMIQGFLAAMTALEKHNEDCLGRLQKLQAENEEICARNEALELLLEEMQKDGDMSRNRIKVLELEKEAAEKRIETLEEDLKESIRKGLRAQSS